LSVHEAPGLPKVPCESEPKVTDPTGVLAGCGPVSVTAAVQVLVWPTVTDAGAQDTWVEVGRVTPTEPVNTYAAPACPTLPSCSKGAVATIVPPSTPTE
jgi:hypothetical protein